MDASFGIIESIDIFYQKWKTGNNTQWRVQNLITIEVLYNTLWFL